MLKIDGNDIKLTRGDTAYITISIVDQDGFPYEFEEGDQIRLQVRTKPNYGSLIFNGNISIVDNEIVWTISHDETKDLAPVTYYYDVELITANGEVFTFIEKSKLKITDEVTYDE